MVNEIRQVSVKLVQQQRLFQVSFILAVLLLRLTITDRYCCTAYHNTNSKKFASLSLSQQQRSPRRSTRSISRLHAKQFRTGSFGYRRYHHNDVSIFNRNFRTVRTVPTRVSTTSQSITPITVVYNTYSSLTDGTILVTSLFLRALGFIYTISFLIALQQNKVLIGTNGITPAMHVLDSAEKRGTVKREERLQWRSEMKDRFTTTSNTNTIHSYSNILNLGWIKHCILTLRRRIRPTHWICRYIIDSNPIGIKLRELLYDRTDSSNRPLLTVLWFLPSKYRSSKYMDICLDVIAIIGCILSSALVVRGNTNIVMILMIWLLHRSIMAVGNVWYSYGWEVQLSELGFHTLFIVPLWSSLNTIFHPLQIPLPIRWCIKWHLFRVMIGAGLIKLRSQDTKWRDLTAMYYFYETQPIPNPLSKYFHFLPPLWHKIEVIVNHIVELVAPWLLILPGLPVSLRRTGGIIQLIFQFVLISCGNLSFLNWLTMVPAIMCLDDALLFRFLSPIQQDALLSASASSWLHISISREVISFLFLLFVLTLSRPVIKNLLSSNQVMNRSYDPYQLINTYGAFGTVNSDRDEYIISSACTWDGEWREYQFIAKPGDVYCSPTFLSPFHYRLDWQMWIAASYGRVENSPWIYSFLAKLLEQDPGVLGLMKGDPWKDSLYPPRYIRIQRYQYRFHKGDRDEKNPRYWDRKLIGNVYPMNGLATLSSLKSMNPNA